MSSRREVLGAGLAAIPVGIGAGLGVRWWMSAGASIRFLGRDTAMAALLDTGELRALFLLGEPDSGLLDNLPQLLPFGRRRIDLVVASHGWLTTEGLRDQLDLHRIATLSLQSTASAPPIRGSVYPVVGAQRLELGGNSDLLVRVNRNETDDTGTNPHVAVEITCEGARMALASHAVALPGLTGGTHLLAIPGEIEAARIERHGTGMYVGTSRPEGLITPHLQAFHDEPVTFTIREGSVRLRRDQLLS